MLFVVLVAACSPRGATVAAPTAPATPRELPPAKTGPATHVVTLVPSSPTPIVRGPFEITTINPGGSLELGVSTSETCTEVVWFSYSGGGAAVADGEVLCARSHASEPVTHGFSGH